MMTAWEMAFRHPLEVLFTVIILLVALGLFVDAVVHLIRSCRVSEESRQIQRAIDRLDRERERQERGL